MSDQFLPAVNESYSFKGEALKLGRALHDGKVVAGAEISIPLKTMNRHGLIAGATGTGKTKTLQTISEGLSDASVPVLLLDIKGDLSGIAASGEANEKVMERSRLLGEDYKPQSYPTEFLSLSEKPGVKLRATVTEFGPVLLSKILGLNDTQQGIVAMIFKYCDDNSLALVDLKDFIKVLQFVSNEGKAEIEKDYGKISTTSTGTILRKVIELQQQGADNFFGERSFDVDDLMRISDDGRGVISVLRVTELQDRPKLFSTFMLQLLAELYAKLPEEGDMDKPKLVMFIDEAHLIFNDAPKVLLEQIETIIKLIRSKAVGVFFCTQNPVDIPPSVLSQLGLKVQHALRAFTAADRKSIKQASENYPESSFYVVDDLITQLGIGEALVTTLNEKGIPTELVHTMLRPPKSRMGVLSDGELDQIAGNSKLVKKYKDKVDENSAYEMLTKKMQDAQEEQSENEDVNKDNETRSRKAEKETSWMDNPMVKQAGRTAASILTRSLLGVLGIKSTTRRRRY